MYNEYILTTELWKKGMAKNYTIARVRWKVNGNALEIRINNTSYSPQAPENENLVEIIRVSVNNSAHKISNYENIFLKEILDKFPIEKYQN